MLIEIDNDNCEADIGIIHKECLIPVNRVLGIAKCHPIESINF
ncbi:hypothetical protein JTT01_06515 [Clostridium botulinum]|nr:hypothetical protein [Clostridium botulinum]